MAVFAALDVAPLIPVALGFAFAGFNLGYMVRGLVDRRRAAPLKEER
jgi:hypothetical protein